VRVHWSTIELGGRADGHRQQDTQHHKANPKPAKPAAQSERRDVYTRITETIVRQLEAGTPYHGINVIMFWIASMEHGYIAPLWVTYKQAQKLGAQVSMGETLSVVADALRKALAKANTELDKLAGDDGGSERVRSDDEQSNARRHHAAPPIAGNGVDLT
jgi:hypothetical protein